MRALLRFFEEVFPALLDDLLRHLDTVWDVLGFFGPLVAVVGLAGIAAAGFYLQAGWLERRLTSMRAAALADEAREPVLEIAPRLKGLRRLIRSKRPILSIRLDSNGMAIRRQTGVADLRWADVHKWHRSGLAEWTLWDTRGKFALALKVDHGVKQEDLKRIDNRLALHTADRPQLTLRSQLPRLKYFRTLAERLRVGRRRQSQRVPEAHEAMGPQGDGVGAQSVSNRVTDQST